MTTIATFIDFNQKYNENNLKTDAIVHHWLYLVFKVDVSHVGKLTKPMIFIDFKANNPRKWLRDPMSIAKWTWKLLKWLFGTFNLPMKFISIE